MTKSSIFHMTLSKWLLIFAIGVAFLAAANETFSATAATGTTPAVDEASTATAATGTTPVDDEESSATAATATTTPPYDPSIHKSCKACTAARSGYWCWLKCNKNAWCDKGGAPECMNEEECTEESTAVKEEPACIEDCPTCIADTHTWCHANSGSGSVCKATAFFGTNCESGFTPRTEAAGCIEDCPTCIANTDYTWCHATSGSGSVCKANNDGRPTCGYGFTSKTKDTGCTSTEESQTTSTTAAVAAQSGSDDAETSTDVTVDDYRQCAACLANRSAGNCTDGCNWSAWCRKDGASECIDETQCTGYPAIKEADKCLPTSCLACIAASETSKPLLWCHIQQSSGSRCTAEDPVWGLSCIPGLTTVTEAAGCIEDCATCTANTHTWCHDNDGYGSVCRANNDSGEPVCESGLTPKTQSEECPSAEDPEHEEDDIEDPEHEEDDIEDPEHEETTGNN